MPNLTPEQTKDIDKRIIEAKKMYEEMKEKLQVDWWAAPQIVPTQDGTFGIIVNAQFVDLKYRNPSPLHVSPN